MNTRRVAKLIFLSCLCSLAIGCNDWSVASRFDLQLATAEEHSQAAVLSKEEIRQINAYLIDRQVPVQERHRMTGSVVRAIVGSGNMLWLHEFCQLGLDGAFGHYQPMSVCQFAVKHPGKFFSSTMVDRDFREAMLNPEQAFGEERTVRDALSTLDAFAAGREGVESRRAEEWAGVLRSMLSEYTRTDAEQDL